MLQKPHFLPVTLTAFAISLLPCSTPMAANPNVHVPAVRVPSVAVKPTVRPGTSRPEVFRNNTRHDLTARDKSHDQDLPPRNKSGHDQDLPPRNNAGDTPPPVGVYGVRAGPPLLGENPEKANNLFPTTAEVQAGSRAEQIPYWLMRGWSAPSEPVILLDKVKIANNAAWGVAVGGGLIVTIAAFTGASKGVALFGGILAAAGGLTAFAIGIYDGITSPSPSEATSGSNNTGGTLPDGGLPGANGGGGSPNLDGSLTADQAARMSGSGKNSTTTTTSNSAPPGGNGGGSGSQGAPKSDNLFELAGDGSYIDDAGYHPAPSQGGSTGGSGGSGGSGSAAAAVGDGGTLNADQAAQKSGAGSATDSASSSKTDTGSDHAQPKDAGTSD
jgi:hypothetical protein